MKDQPDEAEEPLDLQPTTGLTSEQLTDLTARVHHRLGLLTHPGGRSAALGLYRSISLVVALHRHNLTQNLAGAIFDVSQATVSRRWDPLRPLIAAVGPTPMLSARLAPTTRDNYTRLARTHIIPYLGRHLPAQLRVAHVLAWLRGRKPRLSSRTLRLVLSLPERAIRYAQVQEMVTRNVAELARPDQRGKLKGDQPGRPSRTMTLYQAVAVLKAAQGTRWYAYLVLSIVTGARTEEIRALTWKQLGTNNKVHTIHVWTSVRRDGETKTRRSRRSLELPRIAVKTITAHKARYRPGSVSRQPNCSRTTTSCSAPSTRHHWTTTMSCGTRAPS